MIPAAGLPVAESGNTLIESPHDQHFRAFASSTGPFADSGFDHPDRGSLPMSESSSETTSTRRSLAGWFRLLQWPVLLLTVAGLAWLLARDFSGEAFQHVLSSAQPQWLLLSMGSSLLALLVKGIRLSYLGRGLDFRLSLWQGLKYQVIAISLASLTPGRAGEFSKVFLLARHQRGRLGLATLGVILERLLDMLALGTLALIFCLTALHQRMLSLALLLLTMGLLAVTLVLIRLGSRNLALFERLVPERFRLILGEMPQLAWSRLLVQSLLTLVIWLFEGLAQWLILRAAGLSVPILPVLGINALVAISAILSLLPVGLGTVELSALVLYGNVLKVSQAGVLFLVAASRVLNLAPLFALFAGIVFSDRELMQELRAARKPG